MGSGTGAFDKRLLDNNYKNITSCDIDKNNYKLKEGTTFIKIDLNSNFSKKINDTFDMIICLEIIEHLHNTFKFIKQCKTLLNTNGKLIISTPNIHNTISRINFLLFGYPSLFIHKPSNFGHLTPIFDSVLKHYCTENKLKVKKRIGIINFYKKIHFDNLKLFAYDLILVLLSISLYPLIYAGSFYKKDIVKGIISIYIIEN